MSNIYIKLIANHPVLKQTILDIMQMKKEQGDNTPLFVAPKNEERPDKNWTIGVNIPQEANGWYSQAAFGAETDDGQATGGVNVSLKPNDASKSSTGGSGQPAMGGYKKPYQKTGTYGNYRR